MNRPEMPAVEALARLREGNRRFTTNVRSLDALLSHTKRAELATSRQQPVAIVLGCADSRVPAEIVFDQGLGDLFVIRVAGNIVAPSQIGSVEFGAERFGTRLVVVMGHTGCSAIVATLEEIEHPNGGPSRGNLRSITDRVRPSVAPLMKTPLAADRPALLREAMRANVRVAADHLRHGSQLLEQLSKDGLAVVGAEYNLETGEVEFFDGVEGLTG
jgi:carbonic anhydrase